MLTIVIPTRNHAHYLKGLLEVLVNNEDYITQILICNDASTDNTATILEDFKKYKAIEVITNQVNIGGVASMCLLYKEVRNEYVTFMSSDDYFDPVKMRELVRNVKENNSNIGFGKYSIDKLGIIEEIKHPGWINLDALGDNFINLFIFDHYIFLACTVFKKDALSQLSSNMCPFQLEFDEKVKFDGHGEFRAHDWNLVLEVTSLDKNKVFFMDEVIGFFRKVDNQVSSDDRYLHTGRSAYEMALIVHKFYSRKDTEKKLKARKEFSTVIKNLLLTKTNLTKEDVLKSDFFRINYLPVIKSAYAII
jgi:glycosyltransferase involved in cell wall biosynthesis